MLFVAFEHERIILFKFVRIIDTCEQGYRVTEVVILCNTLIRTIESKLNRNTLEDDDRTRLGGILCCSCGILT